MEEIPKKLAKLDKGNQSQSMEGKDQLDAIKCDNDEGNGHVSILQTNLTQSPSIEPIETLEQLLQYNGLDSTLKPIFQDKIELLSTDFSKEYKLKLDGSLIKSSNCPKLLVCHDFRGGYGDDKFVNGTNIPENYTFQQWLQTDIFVYFSHKFITIPPIGWINAAHKHGVKILGTIITESDDGKLVCNELLKNSNQIDNVVEKLCAINQDYMFDGYLVNIENPVEEEVEFLLEFIEKLTKKLKQYSTKNLVIYYDSIINDGKLKWQNELNELNKSFFNICDGIYLNYCWKDENLYKSIEISGNRSYDVFVGVDVFGRGCFGGGGLNTHLAIEKIASSKKLSLAIFAPGWSFECHSYDSYPKIDYEMWSLCYKFFGYKCWTNSNTAAEGLDNKQKSRRCIIFQTDFNRGFGLQEFNNSKRINDKPWFNLMNQSLQPIIICNSSKKKENPSDDDVGITVEYDTSLAFQGGGCLKLSPTSTSMLSQSQCDSATAHLAEADAGNKDLSQASKLGFPLFIRLSPILQDSTQNRFLALLCVWKNYNEDLEIKDSGSDGLVPGKTNNILVDPHLGLAFHDENTFSDCSEDDDASRNKPEELISFGKISFNSTPRINIFLNEFFVGKKHCLQCPNENLEFSFNDVANKKTLQCNGWNFSCYLMDYKELTKYGQYLKCIYLSSSGEISIGYVSLLDV